MEGSGSAPSALPQDARWWDEMVLFDAAVHIARRLDSLLAGVEDEETLAECQAAARVWMDDLEALRADRLKEIAASRRFIDESWEWVRWGDEQLDRGEIGEVGQSRRIRAALADALDFIARLADLHGEMEDYSPEGAAQAKPSSASQGSSVLVGETE